MKIYTQEELDYAVAKARLNGYQEGYELGRGHSQDIKDATLEIPF